MTDNKDAVALETQQVHPTQKRKCARWLLAVAVIVALLLLLFSIVLILALTLFKPKQPRVQLLSTQVEGVAPRLSFPAIDIQLNITLNLTLLVQNRNRVSFQHGPGRSFLQYQDKQVGEADLPPGNLSARGSATLSCNLTLQADEFASDLGTVVRDIMAGKLVLETHTRIPGRVNLLGIFKKHVVATSHCQITIGFPSMKVQDQECKTSTRL